MSNPMPLMPPRRPFMEDDLSRLDRGAQLVVCGLRAIAMGHGDCPALARMFALAFGSGADEAFMGLMVVVRTLGGHSQVRLRVHVPGCLRVSPDERAVLSLLAEAQAALTEGDDAAVRGRLSDMLDPGGVELVLAGLQAVAGTLEVNGYTLTRAGRPRQPGRLAGRTLH